VVGDVGVLLTGDDEMRRLNHRFRGLDKATDVLAFPLGDGLTAGQPFGDLVISAQTARRQAREYGGSLASEIDRLLVHGTLHLCGYDHHERREAVRMHGLTTRLLRELRPVQADAATTRSSRRSRA
jgi:probable rRNA maturation factor